MNNACSAPTIFLLDSFPRSFAWLSTKGEALCSYIGSSKQLERLLVLSPQLDGGGITLRYNPQS